MILLSFDVGIRNLAYCVVDTNEGVMSRLRILRWGLMPLLAEDVKVNPKIGLDHYFRQLVAECGDLLAWLTTQSITLDQVIIENQPALKNPVMKSIQMMVYSYFAYKKEVEQYPLTNISFMAASSKWKCGKLLPSTASLCTTKPTTYKKGKDLSVTITQEYLKHMHQNEWLNTFRQQKKKDDYADSFLQALIYLHKHNHLQWDTQTQTQDVATLSDDESEQENDE